MKVSEALEGCPFDFYYRRKFERIIEKAGVGELDLSQDWYEIRRRVQSTASFNIWGLLLGGLWGLYRGVPYALAAILLVAASIAAPLFIEVDDKLLRAVPYGLGAAFGLYGNSWLLGSYLGLWREYGDKGLIERETRPSLLQPLLAMVMLGITGIVVETPADDLRTLVQAVVPIQGQTQLASPVEDSAGSASTGSQFPPDYDTETFGGKTYGFKLLDGSSCANILFKCGQVAFISQEDCSTLTATYKIFDREDRHLDTDRNSVRDVLANAPVVIKIHMPDDDAYRYEITDIKCS